MTQICVIFRAAGDLYTRVVPPTKAYLCSSVCLRIVRNGCEEFSHIREAGGGAGNTRAHGNIERTSRLSSKGIRLLEPLSFSILTKHISRVTTAPFTRCCVKRAVTDARNYAHAQSVNQPHCYTRGMHERRARHSCL